jgi:prepilin-type N-terminal cleavage/methylation domain-containing protein
MRPNNNQGFTIVELLIVIVVIAILAAISIVAYNGIQTRAKEASALSDINSVHKKIGLYYAENGSYPRTANALFVDWNTRTVRWDANCPYGGGVSDWVPDVGTLPQSKQPSIGAETWSGCYIYVSDGESYILSAWNILSKPQTNTLYRRLGFRETPINNNFYLCNYSTLGGRRTTTYDLNADYYKRSYTVSNVTSCNETPPTGA